MEPNDDDEVAIVSMVSLGAEPLADNDDKENSSVLLE